MDARSDVFAAQPADELITVDGETIEVQPQGIKVPGMPDIPVRLRDVKFRHRCESLAVKLGDGCAPRGERFDFPQLVYSNSRLDIAQVVFEAPGWSTS